MDIRELYGDMDNVLGGIFERLQDRRFPVLDRPEVIQQDFLDEWLAVNYILLTEFTADGRPVIGEVGGIVAKHPDDNRLVLAPSEAGMYTFILKVGSITEPDNPGACATAKKIYGPVRYKKDVTVIDGRHGWEDHNFITTVGATNPLDVLVSDVQTLPQTSHPQKERYYFNVPVNGPLFELLKDTYQDPSVERKVELIKANRELITPKGFIAGFHVKYNAKSITVHPMIGMNEACPNREHFEKIDGYVPARFSYMGCSDNIGRVELAPHILESKK